MKIVLRKRGNQALIKHVEKVEFGDTVYRGVRVEWWYDLEKMEKEIYTEFIDGQQFIYCSGYAGADEQELIRDFDKATVVLRRVK